MAPPVIVPAFGLKRARFSLIGTKKLKVRILNDTAGNVRVRVKTKDAGKSVTKQVTAHRSGRFTLKLRASKARKLAATLRRKGKVVYRPKVTIINRTSGVKKTYQPKIKVKRTKGK